MLVALWSLEFDYCSVANVLLIFTKQLMMLLAKSHGSSWIHNRLRQKTVQICTMA